MTKKKELLTKNDILKVSIGIIIGLLAGYWFFGLPLNNVIKASIIFTDKELDFIEDDILSSPPDDSNPLNKIQENCKNEKENNERKKENYIQCLANNQ